jgi:hypothetical protein
MSTSLLDGPTLVYAPSPGIQWSVGAWQRWRLLGFGGTGAVLRSLVLGDGYWVPGDVFGGAVVRAAVAVGRVCDLLGFEEGGT